MPKQCLSIHGITVQVTSANDEMLAILSHDFHYFLVASLEREPDLVVEHLQDLSVPQRWTRLITLGRAAFFLAPPGEQRRRIFDKAWVSYRFRQGKAFLYCQEAHLAYETLYFILQSYVGERQDGRGLHRIHGLALAHSGKSLLVMAPSGGGKSTLALECLNNPGIALLSDDMPFVGAGMLFAFPQRIGVKTKPEIDSKHVRVFKRARYADKYTIGATYFFDRICEQIPVQSIALVQKRAQGPSRFVEIPSARLRFSLMRWLVMGLETPQIWELFLRLSLFDIARKARILFRRLSCAASLAKTCRFYLFEISTDPTESARVLTDFLETRA